MAFWVAVYYLSIAALVLSGFSLAYVLVVLGKKSDRIRIALEHEKLVELSGDARVNPGPNANQPEFSALKTVDADTGKVTYEMHPVSHSRTEVGTFAYALAIAGVAALFPVCGLAACIAVLVLAPVAAGRFSPSLERVVGHKLIVFSVLAAGIGALASLFSSLAAGNQVQPAVTQAQTAAGLPSEIPMYVPFALLGVLIFSVVVHESAHGLVAYWCGDPTAKNAGRLTLNPMKHFDFFGSFILPALLFFTTGFALGYAKPVPINASRFGRQRRDRAFAATAGATTNFLLAALSLALLTAIAFVISAVWPTAQVSGFSSFLEAPVLRGVPLHWLWAVVVQVLKSFFVVNFVLGIFNMIPIPPLDGSFVLESLLPRSIRFYFRMLRVFGLLIMIVVLAVLVLSGVFGHLLGLVMKMSVLIRFVTHLN